MRFKTGTSKIYQPLAAGANRLRTTSFTRDPNRAKSEDLARTKSPQSFDYSAPDLQADDAK
jgi:hypothetical protein